MRRHSSISLVVALAAAVAFAGPSPANATADVTFYGSGYGHGLGMSQWGAYGLALDGWSSSRILTHFYRGTAVHTPSLAKKVRVALTTDRARVHLQAQAHRVRLWIGAAATGTFVGAIPRGETWVVRAKGDTYAIRDAAGNLVGGHSWGSPTKDLFLTYADEGARVFIPEADGIWGDGFSYARGSIEFDLASCGGADGCIENVIARLGLEDYVDGIGEVPASWPMASLEAQAVAARTFAVYSIVHYGLRRDCACHLTDGSGDQTYIGYDRESGTDGDRWVKAVAATRGRVVTYHGAVIQAFYAASDGGHSDSVQDVWHGGDAAYAIPWLTGVCDPGEWTSANPWKTWTRTVDDTTLTSRLRPYTGSIGTVTTFTRIVHAVGGRIMTAVAVGGSGTATVTGTELRAALGLPDDRMWIGQDRLVTGALRTTYDDLMCAPGLPASTRRAVPGGSQQFFDHGGLYRNGNRDLTLWLRGEIDDEYRAVGSGDGVLGVPTSSVHVLGTGTSTVATGSLSCACKRVDFEGGRLYWKRGVGAHALWGSVLAKYLVLGGAQSSLGFPTTRVRSRADGGTRASFEHRRIVCPAGDACSVVPA
jgi:SpoIID/LytB domain protein